MLKDRLVPLDMLEEDGRDGKCDARGIEPAAPEHVVDKPPVNSAVAVFKRVNEHKAECNGRGSGNWVKSAFFIAVRKIDESANEAPHILREAAPHVTDGVC